MYGNYIDEPIMIISGGIYFYVQDHLYSTAALVDAGGNVAERYEYDAYGQVHILDSNFADDADGVSDCGNPYMFTGRRVDFLDGGKLTLQINRHRYYDYYTGRWLTQDPLGYVDGMNLYEYACSNPLMFRDAQGLSADDEDFFDFNLFWSYVELFVSGLPSGKCGSCWTARVDLSELVLNEWWTSGFCPPLTDQILGVWKALGVVEKKLAGIFPVQKASPCTFPCLCDMRTPWRTTGAVSVAAPNFGVTLYWGVGLSPPGFKFHEDSSHQFACTFHLDWSVAVDVNVVKGKCVGASAWLDDGF